jgi:hypothetical protein
VKGLRALRVAIDVSAPAAEVGAAAREAGSQTPLSAALATQSTMNRRAPVRVDERCASWASATW